MAWTEQFNDDGAVGLYELTMEDAARRLFDGLWGPEQVTQAQIQSALEQAIASGDLSVKRGSTRKYAWEPLPIVLDAFAIAEWAERSGLELESNGAWNDYMVVEAEIKSALAERLAALRSIYATGENESVPQIESDPARLNDQFLVLMRENQRLLTELWAKSDHPVPSDRAQTTYLKIIAALVKALADAHPGTMKKSNGSVLVGTSKDTGDSGIVGHLVSKGYADGVKRSALESHIGKAIKGE